MECNDEDIPRARRAIQWLAFNQQADSELPLEVLAEASVVEPRCTFDVRQRLRDPREILSVLSALVSMCTDDETGITVVFLAHSSVKEYLQSARIHQPTFNEFAISEYSSHVNIAEACLQYLLQFDQEVAIEEGTYKEFPLMAYAADYWPDHARNVFSRVEASYSEETLKTEEKYLEELILLLLDIRNLVFSNWLKVLWLIHPEIVVNESTLPSPVLCAADLDLPSVLKKLIERGEPFDYTDCDLTTPLQIAANRGDETVVRILLENGSTVDCTSNAWPDTPLRLAIDGGFDNIANLLLDFGAKIDDQAFKELTPKASVELVERFLRQGVFENRESTLDNALLSAAELDLYDVGRLLFLNQVDVNCGKPDTPLLRATRKDSWRFVLLLLEFEADLNIMGEDGTALMIAAGLGNIRLVELFLDSGANMELLHDKSGTALILAAREGYINVVDILLDHGADPRAQSSDYSNALLMAVRYEHGVIANMLLGHLNGNPSGVGQIQDAMWAAIAKHCRQEDTISKETLFGILDLGLLHGLLEYPAPEPPDETDLPQPLLLQAWTLWALFYIGPDGCEPAMCLALETDNNEALTLMMDFGAN